MYAGVRDFLNAHIAHRETANLGIPGVNVHKAHRETASLSIPSVKTVTQMQTCTLAYMVTTNQEWEFYF